MTYDIDEAGIHFYIEPDQPAPAPPSVGCAFGSVVEIPPIPDAEAVAEVERVAEKLREGLQAVAK